MACSRANTLVMGKWRIAAIVTLAALAIAAAAGSGSAWAVPPPPTPASVLTTSHQAHSLTIDEAAKGHRVRLRAVVTYYDYRIDNRHGALFVEDSTGGVFVTLPVGLVLPLHAGNLIEVSGVTATGDFAPVVSGQRVKVLSDSRSLPVPLRVTLPYLLTGAADGQWVEVEAIVRSVDSNESNVTLNLMTIDGPLAAVAVREDGVNYSGLVDAKIRLRGATAPLFNKKRELAGARLLFPGMQAISILEPAIADPLSMPVQTIGTLLQFAPGVTLRHRVHIRGWVTLDAPGKSLCVQDDQDGLCLLTVDETAFRNGQLVDLAGFPDIRDYKPTLSDAIARSNGAIHPIQPVAITASQAVDGDYDDQLVQIEGSLVGRALVLNEGALLVSSGKLIFPALLPKTTTGRPADARWQNGSSIRLTGVLSGQVDSRQTSAREGTARLGSFQLLLRSPDDVFLLKSPSWWTAGHALTVLSVVLAIMVVVLIWVMLLRRRVEQQSMLIDRSEQKFRDLAQHDALTGLASRTLLHERLGEALEEARRNQTCLALLMMDIDNFKHVNDSLGHSLGDEILCVTAKRIRAVVRPDDIVARMGGDEFMVLMPGLQNIQDAARIAAKIIASVSEPVSAGGVAVPVSVSIGISGSPVDGKDATTLLQNADVAMYRAKAVGRNCYQFFTANMTRATAQKLEFQVALSHALENGELYMEYQPVVSFKTGEVMGLEALVRWRNHKFGLIMPSDFIPIAEETGLITSIGEWAMREACREVAGLEARLARSYLLSVNISPRQIQQGDLERVLRDILAECRRDPAYLELEITENVLIGNSLETRELLKRVRALGVRLAIDDFGTGFSSLAYVTRFAIDRIKIDQSFIKNCVTDRNSETVTRVIIALAHGLNISVVAEGVETADQYFLLERAECDTAQGFYLSHPVSIQNLEGTLLEMQLLSSVARVSDRYR